MYNIENVNCTEQDCKQNCLRVMDLKGKYLVRHTITKKSTCQNNLRIKIRLLDPNKNTCTITYNLLLKGS